MSKYNPLNLHHLTYRRHLTDEPNTWTLGSSVEVFIRYYNNVVVGTIPVCSFPTNKCYPIKHRGEGIWYISPSLYIQTKDPKIWTMKHQPIHPSLQAVFLVLTNAPAHVDESLALL